MPEFEKLLKQLRRVYVRNRKKEKRLLRLRCLAEIIQFQKICLRV